MTDDPTKRLHEDLLEEPDNSVKGLVEWDGVKSMPHSDFIRNPPSRFVVPKSFVGVEMHFTLIRDDEYAFAYAIVLYYGGEHIEHYILTYWRQNTPFSREDNEEYLLPRDSRWCDTCSYSRREGASNDVRLLMRELGHNTAERF